MIVGMAEFLDKVSKLRKKEDRINALKANDSFQLRTVLQAAFDPRIVFELPEGDVPYKPNELPDQEGIFLHEARKLIYFVRGPYSGMNPLKRERMFIDLLETVDKADAVMLVSIKDKKFPFRIDEEMIREAFPDLLPPKEEAA